MDIKREIKRKAAMVGIGTVIGGAVSVFLLAVGAPRYPVTKVTMPMGIDLTIVGEAMHTTKLCERAADNMAERARADCPRCEITISACDEDGTAWQLAMAGEPAEQDYVHAPGSRIMITAPSPLSLALCHQMARRLREEGEGEVRCVAHERE